MNESTIQPTAACETRKEAAGASNEPPSSFQEAKPIEVEVHGLKAKIYPNCAQEEIVPARFLKKAEKTHVLNRKVWVFRSTDDARKVSLNRWSKVDIRFRGVFQALRKVPRFARGIYENDGGGLERGFSKFGISDDALKAQGQVAYALLDEILGMMDITREAEDEFSYFYLRPRLISTQPEYWTGYRVKHKDTPYTAGSVTLDYFPERGAVRSIIPVSTTKELHEPLEAAMEGKFKLLLAQLLHNIHRLSPPGDKLPHQETFLIGLHGSRLHIFRAIFPGQKTSKLWSGRHNPSSLENESSQHLNTGIDERFYSKQNLERLMDLAEWNQLSNPDNEYNPRVFQILGSQEYDLWVKLDFRGAVKMLVGLILYLLSGHARCGILQDVFERYPYDEIMETESEDENDVAMFVNEQKKLEEKEKVLEDAQKQSLEKDREKCWIREAMRSSVSDQITGFQAVRQPWWDWVWEDEDDEACVPDDDDIVCRGP